MGEDEKIIDNFKYWFETNTENGVSTIPDFICKKLLDLCQKEKEKNDLLTKRFRHLIKSKIISSYDRVKKGKYIKDINKFDTDYINKDKIRAKIKEYEEINMDIFTFEVAEDLKELLKEE